MPSANKKGQRSAWKRKAEPCLGHTGELEYKQAAPPQASGGQDQSPQRRAGTALEATLNLVLKLCSEVLFRKKDGGTVQGVQSLMVSFFLLDLPFPHMIIISWNILRFLMWRMKSKIINRNTRKDLLVDSLDYWLCCWLVKVFSFPALSSMCGHQCKYWLLGSLCDVLWGALKPVSFPEPSAQEYRK